MTEWELLDILQNRFGLKVDFEALRSSVQDLASLECLRHEEGGSRLQATKKGLRLLSELETEYEQMLFALNGN